MKRTLICTALAVLLAGCGGSSSSGVSSSRIVLPAAGGTVAARGVTLTVPPGAVPADATISVSTASGLPEKDRVVSGTALAFTATHFDRPVRIAFALPAGALDDEPAVYKLVDGEWQPMPTTTDDATNSVSALVESFSTYAVLKPDPTEVNVLAQASLAEDNQTPAVKVSWNRNGFANIGGGVLARWQVYRDGVVAPIRVLDAGGSSVVEPIGVIDPGYSDYTSFPDAGSANQRHTSVDTNAAPTTILATQVGRAYQYRVDLVYRVEGLDLPGGLSGTYYFQTLRQNSGLATPLAQPTVTTPLGTTATDGSSFSFQSALPDSGTAVPIQYVVEASTSLAYAGRVHVGTVTSSAVGEINVPLEGLKSAFPTGTTVYVRVGARNPRDVPGPVTNGATHERFVFGGTSTLVIGP